MELQPEARTAGPAQDVRKRQHQGGRGAKRQKTRKEKPVKEGSNDEVLIADVRALFAAQKLTDGSRSAEVTTEEEAVPPSEALSPEHEAPPVTTQDETKLPDPFTEIEVKVVEISSTGDGLAVHPASSQIYVVPFTTPGDLVRVKVIRHYENEHYSLADFISVVEAGPLRDDSRVNCKYFSTCSSIRSN
jgi:tRNA (uracil-5-)-methyltransferase